MSRTAPPVHQHSIAESKLRRPFWDAALFAGLLLWTFLLLCFPLLDTDFWWHLKTGELILHEGHVPQIDWYTFIDLNQPPAWIDLHWGFEILITLLYRLGGANLVILVKATVITLAVAVGWLAGGRNLPVWQKSALWILPIICISGRGYERPEMLSQFFLAAWLWMARNVERRPGWIWFLPLLQLVWVNCHALFILGLFVGFAYAIDCIAREFARGRWGLALPVSNPTFRAIAWVGLLVIVACFVNPYFEEGAFFPATLYRKLSVDQEFYSNNVGEFQRPIDLYAKYGWRGWLNLYVLAEFSVWCLTAASFVWLLKRRRRWSLLRLVLFAGFSHLAWGMARNTNIFCLVSAFVLCENLQDAAVGQSSGLDVRAKLHRNWGMAAVLTGLIVSVVTGAWHEIGDANKPFRLGEARNWFIHDAARFAGQKGFPRRAFVANNGQAAVYIYHNARERLVFMDGRLEVCTRATFEEFNRIRGMMIFGIPDWQEIFRQNGGKLPVVILDNNTSLMEIRGLMTSPGWRLVFSDPTAAVFLSDAQADTLKLAKVGPCASLDRDLREVQRRIERLQPQPSAPDSPDELRQMPK